MNIPDYFALDIGNHSLKMVQIKRKSEKSAVLETVASASSTVNFLENESIDATKKLAEQINQLRESAGVNTNNCVAAVPETPLFSRLLTIPKVDEDKLQETVHWELKPLIPVPLEEVDVAFLEIYEKEVNGQKMVDVYVVAAPKLLTDKFKRLADVANLNLLALETESLANTRAVTYNYETPRDIMICDFGAFSTDLTLSRQGVPVFTQSIGTGSDAFTKAIAADYGLDLEQAEKYKRTFGLNFNEGEGKVARSIEPVMQIILGEMSRTLTYFKEKVLESSIENIYLCGEAAKLPGLSQYFDQHLSLKTILVDPTTKLEVSPNAKKELEQLSSVGFSVAIGLGLKDS
jgi:type IV pilus assembly protein PilM